MAATTADGTSLDEEERQLRARIVNDPELSHMSPTVRADYLNQALDTREAATFLGLGAVTLAKLRCRRGEGPAFLKCGGAVRYQLKDLLLWREQQRRHSTSEYPTTPGTGRPRKPA